MQLGMVIHNVADKFYEDLRQLQSECVAASDAVRKRKIIEYCEVQRHRSLQLLALLRFAKEEAPLVLDAIDNIGKPATERLNKIRTTFAGVHVESQNFDAIRAPRYDVSSAVDILVNRSFGGFPSLLEKLLPPINNIEEDESEETQIKRVKLMRNRVTSQFLSREFNFISATANHASITDSGELLIDWEREFGFSVKLALEAWGEDESKRQWYPTAIRVLIKSDERYGKSECAFIPSKHIPVLANALEKVASNQQQKGSEICGIVRRFMGKFCLSLFMQHVETQAKVNNSVFERLIDTKCRVELSIKGWFLCIQSAHEQEEGDAVLPSLQSTPRKRLVSFSLQHDQLGEHKSTADFEGADLTSISLTKMQSDAVREAAKYQLEQLRRNVIERDSRHHESQLRVAKRNDRKEYELRMQLFTENSFLIASVNLMDGSIDLSTNSNATRWGYLSVEEGLNLCKQYMKTYTKDSRTLGLILADAWNQAEAWDCLACVNIDGLSSSKSAMLPPTPEIAEKRAPGPSVFWDMGMFEGFRYVFTVRFVAPLSAFHASFLPFEERMNQSTLCELISVPGSSTITSFSSLQFPQEMENKFAGRAEEVMQLSEIRSIDDVISRGKSMREARAASMLEECGLYKSDEDGYWRALHDDAEDLTLLQPYELVFKDAEDESSVSCWLRCRMPEATDRIDCARRQVLSVAFRSAVHRNCVLERLVQCSSNQVHITMNRMPAKYCMLVWVEDDQRLFVGFNDEGKLQIKSPTFHPLSAVLARYWDSNNSREDLQLGISLLQHTNILVRAAERYAMKRNFNLRVRATSSANLHFVFTNKEISQNSMEFARRVVDCRLDGRGGAIRWNRQGWDMNEMMMASMVDTVEDLAASFQ